ncbi:MAG: hypothetical protein SGPRY_013890, partial [Prymnesium sp.]
LCINFVNEMLQEYFNENVFDAETALLTSLGLPEIEVQVADNGPRLRLLTTLFARLDDEAKNKHADDVTFLRNVGSVAEEKCVLSHPLAPLITNTKAQSRNESQPPPSAFNNRKDKPSNCPNPMDDRGATFTISHYAGSVVYNAGGFSAKNNDSLHADLIYLISQCYALQSLGGRTVDAKSARTTVSVIHLKLLLLQPPLLSHLLGSLQSSHELTLLISLSSISTTPAPSGLQISHTFGVHLLETVSAELTIYSRHMQGVPPYANHTTHRMQSLYLHAAFGYNFGEVRAQLAYLGVLEVVRIRQQGFPMRLPYEQFLARFEPLLQFGLLPVGHKGSDGRPLSRKEFLAVVRRAALPLPPSN